MAVLLFKSIHPAVQGATPKKLPVLLVEPGLMRQPGEPSADEASSGEYRKPRRTWRGLTIAIETPAGTVRRGRNRHGVTWEHRLVYDYGEILGTKGMDGDPVDIFLGPHIDEAPCVYVVHQRRVNDWKEYDEDKCMAGFMSEDEAKAAFLACYSDPRFLGPVTTIPVDDFVAAVRETKDRPAVITYPPMLLVTGPVVNS